MLRSLTLLGFLLVAGCGGTWATDYDAPIDADVTRGWNVRNVIVMMPADLTTTDENTYAPNADIVWHGDPAGDRKAQVAAIMRDGILRGAKALRGRQRVQLNVTLYEFHGVTPAARARAPSAVHNISYGIQAVDMRTGQPLTPLEMVRADLPAYVGEQAFDAMARGETQKLRVTQHLAAVTAGWLGAGPDPRRIFSSAGR